jgi:hypothetical protein
MFDAYRSRLFLLDQIILIDLSVRVVTTGTNIPFLCLTLKMHVQDPCEISGSHGGRYEGDSFAGYSAL